MYKPIGRAVFFESDGSLTLVCVCGFDEKTISYKDALRNAEGIAKLLNKEIESCTTPS